MNNYLPKPFITFIILASTLLFSQKFIALANPVSAMTFEDSKGCDFSIEIVAAPFAVVDSNKPGIEGPKVATLGVRIINNSSSTVGGVSIHLGDGVAPGNFSAASGGSLSILSGANATYSLGTLGVGQTQAIYWPIRYPATYNVSYPYSAWITSTDGCTASASSQLTTQSEISANANKLLPTGSLLTISPQNIAPGDLVTIQITGFELGTIGQGPKPLKPYDAWLQPVGNADFDPSCMRLVRSEVKINSLSNTPYVNRLYFSGIRKYRSNSSDYVRYTFEALRACSTTIQPYQEAASGTQEKYNADFGASTTFELSSVPVPEAAPSSEPSVASVVQSGRDGGLESEPLPIIPSAFLGGVGMDDRLQGQSIAAPSALHKARLLSLASLSLGDILPTIGPHGTTATEVVPVDVLAVTDAPDANAVDFIDDQGRVKAVALGIYTVGRPYQHDYGVCNRFKSYTFDEISPVMVDSAPAGNPEWFWHARGRNGSDILEEAILFHIFVDEASQAFHIDSRWIQNEYPDHFDYAFDYVFNMQTWSSDLVTSQQLVQSILTRLTELDNGAWEIVYHNADTVETPQVFIREIIYDADRVHISVVNEAQEDATIQVRGSWRNFINRNQATPFEYDLVVPDGETTISVSTPGLLDMTAFLEHEGFTDKAYTGGGLWFKFNSEPTTRTEMTEGSCRPMQGYHTQDLILAGCVTVQSEDVARTESVGLGRTLNPNGVPVDISPYQAIRFWAKGNGSPVRLLLESTSITNGDYYQTLFTPDDQWRQYVIQISEFSQRSLDIPQAYTGTDIKALIWQNADVTSGQFSLSVDQVSFTNAGSVSRINKIDSSQDTAPRAIQAQVDDTDSIAEVSLHYSLDGGETYRAVQMNLSDNNAAQFEGLIPGQPVGSDVRFYLASTYHNGYISKAPLDAPINHYRYRVDDRPTVLIDDFASGQRKNRLEGSAGIFNAPDVGGILRIYGSVQQIGLDYDVGEPGQFAGYFTLLNGLDATAYKTINILVRGQEGGEQLQIGLGDEVGTEAYLSVGDLLPGGLTDEWQWVQVPLDAYPAHLDRSQLKALTLAFWQDHQPVKGQVFIKEMTLTDLPTPIIVDLFDDGSPQRNSRGQEYWQTAENGSLEVQYTQERTRHGKGYALRLDYSIKEGGYGLWQSALNNAQASSDGLLSFWIRGERNEFAPHIYLNDGTQRAFVKVVDYIDLSEQWQQVEIPLQAFAQQGMDLTHLQTLEVVFEHASGEGTVWLDDIYLGSSSGPLMSQRVVHLHNESQWPLALHTANGQAWRATSDVPWLRVKSGARQGPATLHISADISRGLSIGSYTGVLTLESTDSEQRSGIASQQETITVHVTISELSQQFGRYLFLPLILR